MITVIPSLYESFGMVGLESMQHGCATFASNVGGLPEVVGNAGILFELKSSFDLGKKLLFYTKNSHLLRTMGDMGRVRVQEFFSDSVVREVFKKII
jgi:glycosyltransferase involved in cell wall biosynthesis